MRLIFYITTIILFISSNILSQDSTNNVTADTLQISNIDSIQLNQKITDSINKAIELKIIDSISQTQRAIDSIGTLQTHKQIDDNLLLGNAHNYYNKIEIERTAKNDNLYFGLFLLLIAIPATFKLINPGYYKNIFVAYRNPNLSTRQLKEQLSQNSMASLVMDFYFCFSFALLTHAVIAPYHYFDSIEWIKNSDIAQITLLLIGFGIIYIGKNILLKLLGYLFKSEEAFEIFIFNIFLLNKILAFTLLPITALLLFGPPGWRQPVIVVAILIIIFFFIQRYLRSDATFKYLSNYSRLHFFLYLCASEVMPLLILAKAISNL